MSWQDNPEGRRYVAVTNKAVSNLTHEDFDYLRREDPALAEERSRQYDAWWAGRSSSRTAVAPTTKAPAAQPRQSHAADALLSGPGYSAQDCRTFKKWHDEPASMTREAIGEWIFGGVKSITPAPMFLFSVLWQFVEAIDERNKLRSEKIATLEAKVAVLEARPAMDYRGIWRDGDLYGKGMLVTHAGSMWLARSANISRRPGSDDESWQLVVKKGSDAK